jgi:glutamate synthase domain-containing protein 1/glutamate synthase domain-containing protein 3
MVAMKQNERIRNIIDSRKHLVAGLRPSSRYETEAEGGCGVTGLACSVPVRGKHIHEPSRQMHNRGNGRGGGIAAMGFDHEAMGISEEMLEEDYLLHIAVLDEGVQTHLEERFIKPFFRIDFAEGLSHVRDYRDIPGLELKPPEVRRYMVRVKPEVLTSFVQEQGLQALTPREAEDEFVYRNSFMINRTYYDAVGKQSAFVLSHGRNFFILKIVGYAEQVVQYYELEDFKAHIWIAHQRYPTKGRVWHPGGAHPFVGLNEALVHNGDFANYHSVTEYLKQSNIHPLFLTDTEVSVLLFDLYSRIYRYPLEYVIEAIAPTMERDFDRLPEEKQKVYRALQATHIHGSPDGPWFFIVARNDAEQDRLQLIGITDTAMLRPQVFALHDGEVQVGLVCSEKQAIDATLSSLAEEDPRVGTVADRYWNARGGSHTDGGAFIFNLVRKEPQGRGRVLACSDKFGREIRIPENQEPYVPDRVYNVSGDTRERPSMFLRFLEAGSAPSCLDYFMGALAEPGYGVLIELLGWLKQTCVGQQKYLPVALEILTLLIDRRYQTHDKKRRSILQLVNQTILSLLREIPGIARSGNGNAYCLIDWDTRSCLRGPSGSEEVLVIDASLFHPEGDSCDSRLMADAYRLGWGHFIVFGLRGQRFHGCGFGTDSRGVRIDMYGSSGDYLGSGVDGLSIYVHGNAQDQLGQIMKSGKMVIYGDTGQTFMYGAKGGEVYVMGNAAGRPLINAVGRPRVIINGTCLDYLAESFMAGDPHNGGGFVVLNGIMFDDQGNVEPQETPYPGSNLFSLASGGAIYVRDPHSRIDEQQLNGGEIVALEEKDWRLLLPYLEENERLFGISIQRDLLTVDGEKRDPLVVYRKVRPRNGHAVEQDGLEEWGE